MLRVASLRPRCSGGRRHRRGRGYAQQGYRRRGRGSQNPNRRIRNRSQKPVHLRRPSKASQSLDVRSLPRFISCVSAERSRSWTSALSAEAKLQHLRDGCDIDRLRRREIAGVCLRTVYWNICSGDDCSQITQLRKQARLRSCKCISGVYNDLRHQRRSCDSLCFWKEKDK
jgi:hypothetical protein